VIQQGSKGGVEERADVEYGRRCQPLAADSAALCTRFTPISAFRTSQSTVTVNLTVSAFKQKKKIIEGVTQIKNITTISSNLLDRSLMRRTPPVQSIHIHHYRTDSENTKEQGTSRS
jgi:hypothetical protein